MKPIDVLSNSMNSIVMVTIGDFLIRSSSQPGAITISAKTSQGPMHYPLVLTNNGRVLYDTSKSLNEFNSLEEFIQKNSTIFKNPIKKSGFEKAKHKLLDFPTGSYLQTENTNK